MQIFNSNVVDYTRQPLFFGEPVNVARYDEVKYSYLEKMTEKQLSFFWRPEEVDLTLDSKQFRDLTDHEQHIFTSNLKYQILLDSVQGRAPVEAFLPHCSLPELEAWLLTWSFYETIHSRSYTHIIRNVYNDPSEVFDSIMLTPEIMKRAEAVTGFYENFMAYPNPRSLTRCLVAVYALEAIRFYVSFACSFSFAERGVMEGNAKVIKLIARDEALHMSSTQWMINLIRRNAELAGVWDEGMQKDCSFIFQSVVEQETEWADYLFKDGSMIGMNATILKAYVNYIADRRAQAVGLDVLWNVPSSHPLPWMNSWLSSDNVQVAPQEVELSSYLVGQIDSKVEQGDFDDFSL